MPYLIAALPYSIYSSGGLIYNSGNSLIYCKTEQGALLPRGLTFSTACFAWHIACVCWEPGELVAEGERGLGEVGAE